MSIDKPGVYSDVSMADYQASKRFSRSNAVMLLQKSPRHAWHESALNPHRKRQQKTDIDIGNAAHALIGKREPIKVVKTVKTAKGDEISAQNWQTNDAKEQRAAAYEAGEIPLLPHHWAQVKAMRDAARVQLKGHEIFHIWAQCQTEQTLFWNEDSVDCRARPDWMLPNGTWIMDYKTSGSAHPNAFQRRILTEGYDIQAAFYSLAVKRLLGVEPQWAFIVQETAPPYALSVIGLMPAMLIMAEAKVYHAISVWRECLKANRWPGYPTRTCYVDVPGWAEAAWEADKAREEELRQTGKPLDALLHWQAPLEQEVTV